MKKTVSTICALLIFTAVLSQTFEEFKQQQQNVFEDFRQSADEQMKELHDQYDAFVEQKNKEFADFLKQSWEEYDLLAGMERKPIPKPVEKPVMQLPEDEIINNERQDDDADREQQQFPPRLLPLKSAPINNDIRQPNKLPKPPLRKQLPPDFPVDKLNINYYGVPLALQIDSEFALEAPSSLNNLSISSFWSKASKSNYSHLLTQLDALQNELNLNDWAYYKLVRFAAEAIFPDSKNGAVLYTWFLMSQMGFKARVAYNQNNAMLMLASEQTVYEYNFKELDGLKYYLVDAKVEKIQTYGKDFPTATKTLNFNLPSPPNFGGQAISKSFELEYYGQRIALSLQYDKALMSFYDEYPNTQMDIYFNAAPSALFKESVAQAFLPLLSGKSEKESVSLLLYFVQHAFEYAYDHGQFGREKFFFPEELLHYPGSDCEDRSTLFAYLVRELLHLKVIGLQYPDHIATAVHFNQTVGGDFYKFENDHYIVCDPTYVNAPVGKTMPQYGNVTAQLIYLTNTQSERVGTEAIWKKVFAAGGQRSSAKGNIVADAMGNYYIAGFFRNELKLGTGNISAATDDPKAFIASFDGTGELLWVNQPDQHHAMADYIALDDAGNILVAGTFRKTIQFDGMSLESRDQADVFLTSFSTKGKAQWTTKANLDTLTPGMSYIFSLHYSPQGKITRKDLLPEINGFSAFGLSIKQNGDIHLMGASYNQAGMSAATASFASGDTFDIGLRLKQENDRLLQQGYEQGIAGVFAALNIIRADNITIPGKTVRSVLDRYNPSFKENSPTIYESLIRISFLKNEDGIIKIITNDQKPVNFDYMRIYNGATIKITQLASGLASLEVLSGISVGKSIVWYNLNKVNLLGDSGDLIFDYANDNSKRKVNLKKDVLF